MRIGPAAEGGMPSDESAIVPDRVFGRIVFGGDELTS